MRPLATLKNLSLTVPHKKLFESVNFTLNQGDKIGLLGLNGHGKSSLLKVMAGKMSPDTTVPPFEYDKSQNFSLFYVSQELEGDKTLSVSDYFYEFYPEMKELKNKLDKISSQFEDSNVDIDRLIEQQSKLFEKLDELGEAQIHTQFLSYITSFGISDPNTIVAQLSGGEQRKIGLSLGLSAPHEIILWDEPTNHLDLETIKKFEDELKATKKTFILISHDRTLLEVVCQRIMHIQNGKLVTFQGGYSAYLDFLREQNLAKEKELEKLTNKHRRELAWMRQGIKARGTRSKKRVEGFENLESKIAQFKSEQKKNVALSLSHSGRKTKQLIQLKNISFSVPSSNKESGPRNLFTEVNSVIEKGQKIALMGSNGSGKSSLIKIMTKEVLPSSGEIIHSHELKIGHFSQKREELNPNMTPWEWIGEGQDYVYPTANTRRHLASYLEDFLFQREEMRRPISTFSGGEKNRLQLAKFMSRPADLWIFDEPTNDLDLETIGVLEEELKAYEGAVVIVSHDRSFLQNTTDKAWLIYNQEIEFFDAGFDQALEYWEMLQELEAQKSKPQNDRTQIKKESKSKQEKGPNLEDVEQAIEIKEKELEMANLKLSEVNYEDQSKSNQEFIKELTDKVEQLQSEIDTLWGQLDS